MNKNKLIKKCTCRNADKVLVHFTLPGPLGLLPGTGAVQTMSNDWRNGMRLVMPAFYPPTAKLRPGRSIFFG